MDARVRKKEEAKLQELRLALDDHKRAEKERIYAVRYHKVVSPKRELLAFNRFVPRVSSSCV